jgi:hypothetical protein
VSRDHQRDVLLFWWPVVARYGGFLGAFGFGSYAAVTHTAPDAGILAFCGSLVLAPIIFGSQDRRNDRRDEIESETSSEGTTS